MMLSKIPPRVMICALMVVAFACAVIVVATVALGPDIERIVAVKGKKIFEVESPFPYRLEKRGSHVKYQFFLRHADPLAYAYLTGGDCLKRMWINGSPYGVERAIPFRHRKCHTRQRTWLELRHPRMVDGAGAHTDTVSVMAKNLYDMTGADMDFLPYRVHTTAIAKALGLTSLMMAGLLAAGFFRALGPVVATLFYGSTLLLLLNYFSTSYLSFSYDLAGHVGYIKTLVETHALPGPFGWQSQQPPLYYLIAAIFFAGGEALGMNDPLHASRFFSLLLYMGFVLLALLTVARFFPRGKWLAVASALVLFWPEGFTSPGRISNDIGMLFVHGLVMYWLVLYHQTKNSRFLTASLLAALTGLMVKGSAIIGLGAVGAVMLVALWRREIDWRFCFRWPVLLWGLVCMGANFGRTFYYHLNGHPEIKWFLNAKMTGYLKHLKVGNQLENYLVFNIDSFINHPFFFSMSYKGSNLFWNAFLKSLLLGEWFWESPQLAKLLSVLFLVILAYVVYFLTVRVIWKRESGTWPLLVFMGCMIGALIYARITVPWAAQCNGRYVYGMVVILAILFTKTLQGCWEKGSRLPVWIGAGTVLAFCITSVLLIWNEMLILGPA